jgi:hypothetical protein
MKIRAIALASLLLAITSSAFAYYPAPARITWNPGQVLVEIYNPYRAMACKGYIKGETSRGFIIQNWFEDYFIPAGTPRAGMVYSNFRYTHDPIVHGWAEITCWNI